MFQAFQYLDIVRCAYFLSPLLRKSGKKYNFQIKRREGEGMM